ncbi:MAG TPA: UDP-N-acetylmuramate dehydrogenase, partial [Bacillota bacterium]|nr:UDP-N-acetylmuramate dehydrogenase [Bacillota bacterium]
LCEAGTSLTRLSREAADRGLGGLEFACGIPGTVGAAIAINAGAHGGEIGKLVEKVTVLTPEGEQITLSGEEIRFAYRRSSLLEKKVLVLGSTIRLNPVKDITAMRNTIQTYLAKRRTSQPLEYPNAGSVFRNPAGYSAARLIEEAGWKGCRIGDAQVSEKHANFIVNRGNAKSEEIVRLITLIREDIRSKFGIELEPEIRIIPA